MYMDSFSLSLGEEPGSHSIHPSTEYRISLVISLIEDRTNWFFLATFIAFKICVAIYHGKWILCVLQFCQKAGSRWTFGVRAKRAGSFGVRSSHGQLIPPGCYMLRTIQDNSGVKGPQGAPSPTCSSKQDPVPGQHRLLWAVFNQVLKTFKDRDSTTSLSS